MAVQGVRFRMGEDVFIYGIQNASGLIIELDAAHRFWGHSGNMVGTLHEPCASMEPYTLKPYMVERLRDLALEEFEDV